jgi:hypothetical protein
MRTGFDSRHIGGKVAESNVTGQEVIDSWSNKTSDLTISIFAEIITVIRRSTDDPGVFDEESVSRGEITKGDFDTSSEVISSLDVLEFNSTKSFTDNTISHVLPTQEIGEFSRNRRVFFVRENRLARIGSGSQFMEDSETVSTT